VGRKTEPISPILDFGFWILDFRGAGCRCSVYSFAPFAPLREIPFRVLYANIGFRSLEPVSRKGVKGAKVSSHIPYIPVNSFSFYPVHPV
jgi:hypothetical protein